MCVSHSAQHFWPQSAVTESDSVHNTLQIRMHLWIIDFQMKPAWWNKQSGLKSAEKCRSHNLKLMHAAQS